MCKKAVDVSGHRVVLIGMSDVHEEEHTVAAELGMALTKLLRNAGVEQDVDFPRDSVWLLAQSLMDLEVSQHLGAERRERTASRTGPRRSRG